MSTMIPTSQRVVSIATLDDKQIVDSRDMRKLVTSLTPILAKSLPVALKGAVDRYGGSLIQEMNRNPYLANSTAMSLLGLLMQTAQLGLELGGVLGQSYGVPYWNNKIKAQEAQFQIGYKGLIALAHRADPTKVFDAHPVFEGDEFDIQLGGAPKVHHKPLIKGDRGELVGVYATFGEPGLVYKAEWMTATEIEKHKEKYSKKDKQGQFSAAWTGGHEMHRKTVLRRLGKRVPMSVEIMRASSLDECADDDVAQNLGALVKAAVDMEVEPPSPKAQDVLNALGSKDAGREPGDEDIDSSGVPR